MPEKLDIVIACHPLTKRNLGREACPAVFVHRVRDPAQREPLRAALLGPAAASAWA